jgi:hypothetical protein
MAEAPKAEAPEKAKGFWQTLPGILTGLAALITAVTGLVLGIMQVSSSGSKPAATEKNETRGAQTPLQPQGRAASEPRRSSNPSASGAVGQTAGSNLLAAENGGRLIWASSPDWRQTTVGSQGYGVVGGHDPEEAVYGFRNGAAATFSSFKMLFSQANPSNVRRFELLVSNDSATSGFRSIGRFEAQNAINFDVPYQEFRFPGVKARFFKVRLLLNQNGYKNPFEVREFQLPGELEKQ